MNMNSNQKKLQTLTLSPREHRIWAKKDASAAVDYALSTCRRFLPAEEFIRKSPFEAVKYARDVIMGRWPVAEDCISTHAYAAYTYARDVIQGEWKEGEKAFASDPFLAYFYVVKATYKRFEAGEAAICKDKTLLKQYIDMFPEAKDSLILSGKIDWMDV